MPLRRRLLAVVVFVVGVVVLGIGARNERDAAGGLELRWTWWRSEIPHALARVAASTLPVEEVVAAFDRHRLTFHAIAAALALAFGLATARGVAAWTATRVGAAIAPISKAWLRVAACFAWWCALEPEVVCFVATRTGLGATQFLDVEDAFRALGVGTIVIAAAIWIGGAREKEDVGSGTPSPDRLGLSPILAVLFGVLVPALVSRGAFQQKPLINDEHSYLFQSRLFAHGELVYDAQGLDDFFPARQVAVSRGKLFSKYPPAHAALLSIGERVGLPELLPRLLAAVAILATWDLARRAGVSRPSWAAWLLALSPMWIGLESLWLSHTTSIPCSIVLVWSVLTALDLAAERRTSAARWRAVLAGLAFGVDLAARPVTALAVALPLVVLVVTRRPRGSLALVLGATIGALPGVAVLLWMNHALTGSAFEFAYELYAKSKSSEDRFGNVSLASALENTSFNLTRLSTWICGVGPGVLLVALGRLFTPTLRWRSILCAVPLALLGAYAFHPYQGIPLAGPLYLSEALPELAILGACGLTLLADRLGRPFVRLVWIAIVVSSALLLQSHFANVREEARLRADAFRPVHDAGIARGVVFVHYATDTAAKRFPLYPPAPDDPLVFAFDLGRRNRELLTRLGQKDAWLFFPESGVLRRWK